MAVLRYKDDNGVYQDIVGINVQNEVVQTTGQSTTAVMSQKAVSDLIPAQASASNQLADKDFVNSSVSTATATYQGSYNLVSDLSLTTQASHGQIEDALGGEISGADNNDYAFVQIPTSDSTPTEIAAVERYKFNGTRWSFEYTLNNSGFTAEQWAAVNSGITSGLVAKINALSGNPQSSIASLFGMDSSGNFQNISAANLASVLGAPYLQSIANDTVDLDTILNTRADDILATSNWESRHLPLYGHGICITFGYPSDAAGNAALQFYVCSTGIFIRRMWAYKVWGNWKEL